MPLPQNCPPAPLPKFPAPKSQPPPPLETLLPPMPEALARSPLQLPPHFLPRHSSHQPTPLPNADFSPRRGPLKRSPMALHTLLQTLPALLANLLLEKKLPREAAIFMASINDNGTVSITAPQGYPSGYYAPYCDLLAKATLQHIAPENNTYEAFRPAPTSDSLLINRVSVSALSADPTLLQKYMADGCSTPGHWEVPAPSSHGRVSRSHLPGNPRLLNPCPFPSS